jgi:ribonuclease P protein component
MSRNTFSKTEILRGKTSVDLLFAKGKKLHLKPIRMVYRVNQDQPEFPARALFVVPKSLFKKAHDRNRLRRRMRESYRLYKNDFYRDLHSALTGQSVDLAFLYTDKTESAYGTVDAILKKLLNDLIGKLKK